MRITWERFVTSCIAAAAVTVAGTVVYRELGTAHDGQMEMKAAAPVHIEHWPELMDVGIRLGRADAPVQIVEFGDFECPFCRRFHQTLTDAVLEFGDDVSAVFIHFPLGFHRFARPAAKAAECAQTQGKFWEFAGLVFEKQDSLGLKEWQSYAAESGVPNLAEFGRCISVRALHKRIEEGLALGNRLKITATPTVVINGMLYAVPPYDSLATIVRRIVSTR
jgi:protein-disulfide isomerase